MEGGREKEERRNSSDQTTINVCFSLLFSIDLENKVKIQI